MLQRELREGARRPANRRLRLAAAIGGIIVLWCVVVGSRKSSQELGSWLFASLHTLLLGLIAVAVPALAADGIAREKREGTLGLLFLTSLSARGIVAGKALAQALRAFTLWLAVLPILTIPFVLGGVTWFDVGCALSLEFCVTVLCLAAGLLASSIARERNTAFVLAFLLGGAFLFLFSQFDALALFFGYLGSFPTYGRVIGWWEFSTSIMTAMFSGLTGDRGMGAWSSLRTFSVPFFNVWECLCLAGPILASIVFRVVARFAMRRIERSWQDQIPSARRLNLLRRYCTPLFQNRFRNRMQRSLDRNPIAWLQQYSWKARMTKWGLCLAFLLMECLSIQADFDNFQFRQFLLLLTLAGFCTFAGVNGFMAEKRSGALELLLTTPVSVNSIIFGRSWGLWKQFLPACLVLIGFDFARVFEEALSNSPFRSWIVSSSWVQELPGGYFSNRFAIVCGLLVLPFCTTYSALRVKNLFAAALLAWIAVLVPLMFAASCCEFNIEENAAWFCKILILGNIGLVWLLCFLLRHSLSRRIYSF